MNFKFKSLVPILKNEEILQSLYVIKDQFSLEKFLKDKKIELSIEEIEMLWDIIEACKSSDMITALRRSKENNKYTFEKSNEKVKIQDSNLDISGGQFEMFNNNILKVAKVILEGGIL